MPSGQPPVYDRIGSGYTETRRPDPRIAAAIGAALGDARTLVNVGAGAGAYEPRDRRVVAVEPSGAMIDQRPTGAAPCIQARRRASALPRPGPRREPRRPHHPPLDGPGRGPGRAPPGRAPTRRRPHVGPRRPRRVLAHRPILSGDPRPRPPAVPAAGRARSGASERSGSSRSRSPTTARTGSSARSGAGPRRTSTPPSAAPFPRSALLDPEHVAAGTRAPGRRPPVGTLGGASRRACGSARASISATAWSSPSEPSPVSGRGEARAPSRTDTRRALPPRPTPPARTR